jgi:hypothetical protein
VQGVSVPLAADSNDPLINLGEFSFHAPLRYEQGKPVRISAIKLKGLDIHIPPKSHFAHLPAPSTPPAETPNDIAHLISFVIEKIVCTDAHVVLETSKPGKLPLDFAIARFELTGNGGRAISSTEPAHFEAELTNPRPVGTIHSSGSIGPWQEQDPGESPIQGEYQFDNADLSSFKGIAGILSSTGKYEGSLRDITADGDTDTPDFRLTHFGNSLPLHTHFHAKVDGTNGDTWLDPVNATLGHSHFTAQGQVVRVIAPDPTSGLPTSKGHDIAMNVNVDAARIEDFLRLASHSPDPLLTGALKLKAKLHIPPGVEPVHKRMEIKGTFDLDEVRFSSDKIQGRITELSLRGQGKPKEVKGADASLTRSTMTGDFRMANGEIDLPALTYTVPGATIDLSGTYGVDGGALNFIGTAKLQATVSQLVGGVAGFFLKPADRFFKKDGAGTDLPIHISGTREDPQFGVDFNRMHAPHPQPPASLPTNPQTSPAGSSAANPQSLP